MNNIPEAKKKVVSELVELINSYPIIGVVDMENMPTPQLQTMRAKLRGSVVLKMTKKRFMKIALKEAKKKGIEDLEQYMKGMPALIFTKENPFTLFKTLKKNKSTAPAKAGQTAPKDIEVKAGATSFAPGPIIGELGAVGIKAGIEGGKVAIKEDVVVLKEGEEISRKLAELLTRLKIEPMEIGLDLTATYEDETIFTKDILDVSEEEFIGKITQGASWAFNLAMEAGFPTSETTTLMITKAFNESKALALEQNILTDVTTDDILANAQRQAMSLNSHINGG